MLAVFSLITGILYPLLLTGVAGSLMPHRAGGSLIWSGDRISGSELLGRKTGDARWFQARPSACGWTTVPSAAANAMPGSRDQKALQTARAREFRQWNGLADTAIVPDEMITASASGLDPHIGREAALLQVARIAKARGIAPALVTALVVARTEPPQFGFLGQERVNVVLLNVELDRMAGP